VSGAAFAGFTVAAVVGFAGDVAAGFADDFESGVSAAHASELTNTRPEARTTTARRFTGGFLLEQVGKFGEA